MRSFIEPSPCVTAHWLHRPCVTPYAFIIDDGAGLSEGLTTKNDLEPAFTVAASSNRGGRAWLEQGQVVSLTPRALARFQTFPDSYQLPAKRILASRVIGNAVPPSMAEKLLLGIKQVC